MKEQQVVEWLESHARMYSTEHNSASPRQEPYAGELFGVLVSNWFSAARAQAGWLRDRIFPGKEWSPSETEYLQTAIGLWSDWSIAMIHLASVGVDFQPAIDRQQQIEAARDRQQ